jgi:hypothetical protein
MVLPLLISGQETNDSTTLDGRRSGKIIYGFIRAGGYGDLKDNPGKPFLSSIYSDLGLKIESSDKRRYRAIADVRFRYGSEFHEPVSSIYIKEAYVEYTSKKWDISGGQKIIKWGRADFTNPTSKLNPQNYISRSPDREDMDMGNLLASLKWYPSQIINFQAVVVPYYRSSVLLIDPIPLPANVKVNEIQNLITSDKKLSYGLKADFHLRGIDFSTSWFDGYDPMPGIALTMFSLDMSGPVPVPSTELSMTPYKTRILGADFESSLGMFGIRGEGAWSVPYLSWETNEFVPLAEVKWVFGIDWTSGNWRIIGEYSGKTIPNFTPSSAEPILGTEPDYVKLAQLLATPGFDVNEYVRQQVAAFNRLYNYQLKSSYHSAGLKVETDLFYGKVLPSLFTMYNFTSHDLLLIPEIRIKPSDGLTMVAGVEFYSGGKGSLYDIVNDFMNSVYVGLRVDF